MDGRSIRHDRAETMNSNMDYAPLDIRSLRDDLPSTCDLYIEEGGTRVLYREASRPFTMADRERLLSNGVSNLWIRIPKAETPQSQQHLTTLLSQPNDRVPLLAKAGLLYTSAAAVTRQAIANAESRETIADLEELVSATVGYLACSRAAFPALLSVMLHDFSIYTHAINVAVYAIGLARFVGITDHQELRSIGFGAILHDVGKVRVPKKLLNKRTALSTKEWAIMRQHPAWGKEILSAAADLPESALTIVVQHHERLDGSGYPEGIVGEQLHQHSMIVALVDAYDAMTSRRPYRIAHTPFSALSILKREIQGKLDPSLFPPLVRLLGTPSPQMSEPGTAENSDGDHQFSSVHTHSCV